MPCNDGGGYYSYEDKSRLDAATRAACEAITLIQNTPMFAELSVETRAWWNAHQKADAARIASEQEAERQQKAKRDALNKLSADERRALGIY